jgi:Raf kinase inhibitor-like YbhB/YbcL family protein
MHKRIFLVLVVLLALLAITFGCKGQAVTTTTEGDLQMTMQLTSSVLVEGGSIPKQYTCDGLNTSPDLAWTGVPSETKSLALIVDDPDAPAGDWVHWVLYDLPPDLTSLPEGVQGIGTQGVNDFRKTSYGGPCPPRGSKHRYFFKIYALDQEIGLQTGMSKATLEKAMQGHVLAQGQLMGIYSR